MSAPQDRNSPFRLFKDMLATLLSVPKEEVDEEPGQEQTDKYLTEEDAADPHEDAG
jgi:hypothetical protein